MFLVLDIDVCHLKENCETEGFIIHVIKFESKMDI